MVKPVKTVTPDLSAHMLRIEDLNQDGQFNIRDDAVWVNINNKRLRNPADVRVALANLGITFTNPQLPTMRFGPLQQLIELQFELYQWSSPGWFGSTPEGPFYITGGPNWEAAKTLPEKITQLSQKEKLPLDTDALAQKFRSTCQNYYAWYQTELQYLSSTATSDPRIFEHFDDAVAFGRDIESTRADPSQPSPFDETNTTALRQAMADRLMASLPKDLDTVEKAGDVRSVDRLVTLFNITIQQGHFDHPPLDMSSHIKMAQQAAFEKYQEQMAKAVVNAEAGNIKKCRNNINKAMVILRNGEILSDAFVEILADIEALSTENAEKSQPKHNK